MLQKKLNMQEQILRIMHQVFKPNHQAFFYLISTETCFKLIFEGMFCFADARILGSKNA